MLNILEVVQMIRIYVENYLHIRLQFKEAVPVFAGFRYEVFSASHVTVAPNFLKISSHKNGRLPASILENQ